MSAAISSKKRWIEEELEYLGSSWGQVSIPAIAKKLDRTLNAVRLKAHKIGLTRFIHFGEYITLNQLIKIIYKNDSTYCYKSAKFRQIPTVNKKVCNKSYKVFYMQDFWNWLENNKNKVDLSRTEKYELGPEPAWVEEKRKADKLFKKYKRSSWTKDEDERLKKLLSAYRYGYREISIKLKRTECAIITRILDLNIKARPLRADNHTLWTPYELKVVKNMHKAGYKSAIIAEHVNRSAKAIDAVITRRKYFKESEQ